jgi:transcription-repair coupling factor (superfamily II helicase)
MTSAINGSVTSRSAYPSPFKPEPLSAPGSVARWGRLYGSSYGVVIGAAAQRHDGPLVVVTPDTAAAERLIREIRFYTRDEALAVDGFPDWETLSYDVFSPHQDIISQRLRTLYHLPDWRRGVLVLPVTTFIQRLPPRRFLHAYSLILRAGQSLDVEPMRLQLEAAGYRCVSQVSEHGEFAVRGSLLDLFPMGSELPYRIDLLDRQIETLRTFDPETQRSVSHMAAVELLPAREFPMTAESIKHFRQAYRDAFEGDPQRSVIYRDVSRGLAPAGIEYYLPLFFDTMATLFDYVPANSLFMLVDGVETAARAFLAEVDERFEQRRVDPERPLLAPGRLYMGVEDLFGALAAYPRVELQHMETASLSDAGGVDFATAAPPVLKLDARLAHPTAVLEEFIRRFSGRVLVAAETPGRREVIKEMLHGAEIHPAAVADWREFLDGDTPLAVTVGDVEQGLIIESPPLAVITEPQLFGERAAQSRRRRRAARDSEAVIRDLTDLNIGAPVVHIDHGVGRYLGLQVLNIGGVETEFLALGYADGDKLYVPVSSLHLINRYTGAGNEEAPLHKLGSGQWQRVRQRAAQRAHDVAVELLDVYARRAAHKGYAFQRPDAQYNSFCAAFPFEETPDQEEAIRQTVEDMAGDEPMDRLICGDVGFGKTEVAMRAAFIAVQSHKQVAVLVPTTLLAQQHYQNFRDRFADWPVRIELLSRFQTRKHEGDILQGIATGTVDIVIGTHKLLQAGVKFKRLGLIILDEEHRFGVRHKERLKALRADVDVLTLTATPIPRTLNMALSGIRDMSIIATPPLHRLAVKTFVREWDNALIREACLRELKRGGQVYVLHNEVKTIDKTARDLHALVPEGQVRVAHGQMRERELEQVMLDFYHQRCNVLVCSTIIESGIDVPNANTIIINRADKFGLAQLYQLRGRVGRSHHQAYAFLLVPSRGAMTPDALKRLEAIESLEELGSGFMLATHDLEIRGAGELLGDEQSGHMHEVGFSLYMELLERAVQALKAGRQPDLDKPLDVGTEVDMNVQALIPEDYLPDIHTRLVMYKRIASAPSDEALRDLQVEMIDRFGLLPDAVKVLFRVTHLKLLATPLGVRKVEAGTAGGRLLFSDAPKLNTENLIAMIQRQSQTYKLDGQERLRFKTDLADVDDRFMFVEDLLGRLTPP